MFLPFCCGATPASKNHTVSGVGIIICFLLIMPASAQPPGTDSLLRVLPAQQGVERLQTLDLLATSDHISLDSALIFALESFHLAQERKELSSAIASEYQLGVLYTRKKQDSVGLKHFFHALERAENLGDPMLIYSGKAKLASYYTRVNRNRESIAYAGEALAIARQYNYPKEVADAYVLLGSAYRKVDGYEKATENYFSALRTYEALGDREGSAGVCNSIGVVYLRTGDFDDALIFFERALRMNSELGNLHSVVFNRANIGVVYQKKKAFDSAISHYQKVLPLTREVNERGLEAVVMGNIGSTLVSQGKLEEGLGYLDRTLMLKEQNNDIASTLHTLNDIADVQLKLGNAQDARKNAERVVSTASEYKVTDQLRYGLLYLSKSYRQAGDFEKALSALDRYTRLTDSLFQIEKAGQINELQIQYETEKKDMEISALQQEQAIADAQRKIYFLAGALVVLILLTLYFSQRLKAKRNQQLLEKEREVDRMKSDFFANISHEFRTPLSLILGPIETMLDKAPGKEQEFQLGLMKKSASRLLRLINQILELSKLKAGYLELKATELEGVSLIRGVVATFESFASEKGIVLEFENSVDALAFYGEQEKIETIVINLLSNAFKFSDTGGRIGVSLSTTSGSFELRVEDTGVGIAREHLDNIFDRFYRVGSSSEKVYQGTGIGLSLTKELVVLHGGTIDVTSEVGKGTRVMVTIPLGKEHLREYQIVERATIDTPLVSAEQLSPATVLPEEDEEEQDDKPFVVLIEDNPDVRDYITSILRHEYVVRVAPNGVAGLELATSVIPDLIISDVMMPEMDGYETCRRIKQDERTSHIPVILLTAKSSVHSRILGLETEADLYLSKPFVPRELMLCIHNLIQSRRKLRERYNRQVVLKPLDIAINSADERFLERLLEIVQANFEDEDFSVEQLSREIGMSRSQIHRKLHALTGESASQFIRTFRLQRAMEMLRKGHGSVSEIAYKVGFSSHPYFNKCFSGQYGCTPSSVRETTHG